jgi:hypothetical protein
MISLYLDVKPKGSLLVTVNDKGVDPDTMTTMVPFDQPLTIYVEKKGYKSVRRETVYDFKTYGKMKEVSEDIDLEQIRYGYLSVHTTPNALASISIEGKPWVKSTPFEDEKLPIGSYTILLKNEGLGWEKTVQVTVHEGKRVILENIKLNPKE